MTIFFLAVLAPVSVFYVYALVNFQRELRRVKRAKRAGAITIPLDLPLAQAIKTVPERSTVVPIEPECERDNAGSLSHDWRAARITALRTRPPQEFYQLESAYAGPLFVVPLQDEDVAPDAYRHTRALFRRCTPDTYELVPLRVLRDTWECRADHSKPRQPEPISGADGLYETLTFGLSLSDSQSVA